SRSPARSVPQRDGGCARAPARAGATLRSARNDGVPRRCRVAARLRASGHRAGEGFRDPRLSGQGGAPGHARDPARKRGADPAEPDPQGTAIPPGSGARRAVRRGALEDGRGALCAYGTAGRPGAGTTIREGADAPELRPERWNISPAPSVSDLAGLTPCALLVPQSHAGASDERRAVPRARFPTRT